MESTLKNGNKFKAIDFFCGEGGMTCGLRQAGIDVIAGVDFDGKEPNRNYGNTQHWNLDAEYLGVEGVFGEEFGERVTNEQ